ncbi:transposase [Canicola haemoglobinophilus]|uniref:Transposase n=1 Tax=Canicola haemoglobinophilus TaxID=733 RepID=A0A377HRD0_9PAST|nr:transposase [Canicola haemoglobinophilus]
MLRKTFPLAILLPIANLARSSFFYHNKPKTDKDSEVKARILEIKQKEPHYGYRRVAIKLGDVNHKRVQRLIKEMGLQVLPRKRRTYRSYRGEVGKIAPNQLQRNFKATQPAQKWLTDITEFRVKEEKLYFSPILDCFNNEIIAYNLSRRPNFQQVQQMLEQAVRKCPKNATPILHSDQGWQYQMRGYQALLKANGIRQSMSRKGNCLDNAAMESFFGRLKTECFHGKSFESIEALEQAIRSYVRYYNEERIQLKLKGLSPIQYRRQSLK